MSAVESLAGTISEPITTTTQAAENIEAYKGLIAGELKEVTLVFDEVCELMPNTFYLENQQHIAFIRSRFDSIGELAQDLAKEYEAQAKATQGAKYETSIQ